MKLSSSHIMQAVPHADGMIVNAMLLNWQIAEQHGIVTTKHTAYFLGNAAVETFGFTRLDENLFYTTTARLKAVWPSRFKSDALASACVRNPQKLANAVYGGRLGNTGDDDGWLYRGSGLLQTTGKANFAEVAAETGIDCVANPELLRSFPAALEAACIYWQKRNLGKYADAGDVEGLTKAIQGGTGGLNDRRLYISRFLTALAPAGHVVVKLGMRGDDVVAVQTMLAKTGHYGGKIDGLFGLGTDRAVRDFQTDQHLSPVDGVVGPNTMNALIGETQ